MFSIIYTDPPNSIGTISIGDFQEDFEVTTELNYYDIQNLWETELIRFTNDSCNSILLPTWFENNIVNRAWVLYKVHNNVYIQERLLCVTGKYEFRINSIPERETHSEDGDSISEWEIKIDDIINFIDKQKA